MSNELTDNIEIESSIPENSVSEDLANAMTPVIEEKDSLEAKGVEILKTFEEIKSKPSLQLIEQLEDVVFPQGEAREEYLRNSASVLYLEIFKKAKIYLRNYCNANDFIQVWTMRRPVGYLNPTERGDFIAARYSITFRSKIDPLRSSVIVENIESSLEASIFAAKRLGFDNSTEKALAFKKISSFALEKILKDEKYLKEQRDFHVFEEIRNQIVKAKFKPQAVKDAWLAKLEEKRLRSRGVI